MNLLTAKDIQNRLSMSSKTAYKLICTKGFPSIKIGKRYYVPEEDFNKWIEKNIGKEIEL